MSDIERVKTNRISVATTKTQYRQKGYMGRLIAGSLEYQQQLKIPFCFVESGNKSFWEHFGFAYIYDRPQYELNFLTEDFYALKQHKASIAILIVSHPPALQIQYSPLLRKAPKMHSHAKVPLSEQMFCQKQQY